MQQLRALNMLIIEIQDAHSSLPEWGTQLNKQLQAYPLPFTLDSYTKIQLRAFCRECLPGLGV